MSATKLTGDRDIDEGNLMRERFERGLKGTPTARINKLADAIQRIVNPLSLARQVGGKVAEVDTWLESFEGTIEAKLQEFYALTGAVREPAKSQADIERVVVEAFTGLAQEVGSGLWLPESLHALLMFYVAKSDYAYICAMPAGRVAAMPRHLPTVNSALVARGVLTWYEEPDKRTRVVDTNAVTAHVDIYCRVEDVRSRLIRGRRCVACLMEESPISTNLISIDHAKRGLNPSVDANTGATKFVDGALTHRQCVPTWNKMLAIAGLYATREEAQAADEAAGRSSREMPEMPEWEPDPPPTTPKGYTESRSNRPEDRPTSSARRINRARRENQDGQ